jgi:UDP-N-acetyl-2-amino-2-deoxyglucuronate dehydrogenase
MDSVRVGVIGCGVMGKRHAAFVNTHPNGIVTACADLIKDQAEALAQENNIPHVFESGKALIEKADVDAVILALPTCWRTPLALQALAKGLHVLVEKPVAMNVAEVKQLMAAQGDLIVGCCSSRFSLMESAKAVATAVDAGRLGNIRSVSFRCIAPAGPKPESDRPKWRLRKDLNGGGIMVNWGCYDLDLLLSIAGGRIKPESVYAATWGVPPGMANQLPEGSHAETHFMGTMRCADSIVFNFERAEYATAQQCRAWCIVGDKGSLALDILPLEEKRVVLTTYSEKDGVVEELIWEGDEENEALHEVVVHDFIDAIANHRPCKTDLEKSLLIQKITDATYQSSETGKVVSLDSL